MTDELRIDYLPLSELKRHPRNPKDHDLGAISRSVNRFGFTAPVILDERTGYLAAGHGRIDTLAQLKAQGKQPPANVKTDKAGEWLVPVVRGHGFNSDVELEAFLVADNRITALGGWNEPELVALLQDLAAEDEALLEVTGYDGDDLQALIDELGGAFDEPAEDKGAQIDRAAELQAQWQTERGQLWIIPSKTAKGEHRLLCGDSTNAEDVARVMAGERADAVITDPPYGMHYDPGMSNQWSKKGEWVSAPKNYAPVIGDDEDYDPRPLMEMFKNCDEQFWWGADYYAERIPNKNNGSWLVWDKRDGIEDVEYSLASFELCWSKQRHRRDIIRKRWMGVLGTETQDTSSRQHPTQKPVEVIAWIIEHYASMIVTDPYGGSGTTMVACEQLGRLARLIEIEPKYAAVILQRMADMGLEPRLAD